MGRKNEGRSHAIGFKLTDEEFDLVETGWKKSNIIHLSEYLRRVLLEKPITFYTRNQSLDELMGELILLRRELNTIRTNLDEAILRLQASAHLTEVQYRLDQLERVQSQLVSHLADIKMKINSISLLWLQ